MDVGQRGDPLYTRDCLTDGQKVESLVLITAHAALQNGTQKKQKARQKIWLQKKPKPLMTPPQKGKRKEI